ncbi:MAG: DUF4265 domain-containing protein [Chitinophagales bacterium]
MRKKVTIVYKDIEDNIAEELVWCIKMDDNYKVDNIPFYAPNLSLNDIISVENDKGILYLDDIIQESGHSTIQIIFLEPEESENVLKKLEEFGCSWEGMENIPYYAIDIPPQIDYIKVKDFLNLELSNNILDFKESCLAH